MELTKIQMVQDFEELYEECLADASNNRIWAKEAADAEQVRMFEENAERAHMRAQMYRRMAKYPDAVLKLFMED